MAHAALAAGIFADFYTAPSLYNCASPAFSRFFFVVATALSIADSGSALAAMSTNDDYTITKLTSAEAAEVLDFLLVDFVRSEPLNQSIGLSADEARQFFGGW